MSNVMFWVRFQLENLKDREDGATAVEYGLMVGLIAIAIIVAVTAIGDELNRLFTEVQTRLEGVITPATN
ncbi:MAG: Flp family type IVb pilin [Actinomycetota bacterium]